MANKKNTNTQKSDVKKDSLKNTSNTSNKSNVKGKSMSKKDEAILKLEKNQKATAKKALNAVVYEFNDGTSKILNKRYFDVTTDKGNTYRCVVDLSMASNMPVFPIEVPTTGLAPQKSSSVIFCPKSKSKWGVLKAEEFIDTKGIISASNKARRGMKWDEYVTSILNSKRVIVDKTTGAKSEVMRYFALDKGNKAHALIVEYARFTLNKWEILNDIQKAKALKAKNAGKISA